MFLNGLFSSYKVGYSKASKRIKIKGETMSNTFEILMDQLDMPLEMRSSSAFLHAEIQEVVVHKVSRVWDLYHPSDQSGFFCGFIAGLLPGGL